MYMRLNTRDHKVVDTPVGRFLQRKTGDPNIFTYFHKRRGTWVAATWINRNGKVAYEHFAWEGGPAAASADKVLGFMVTKSDKYRAYLKELAAEARLYEKHMEDEAITFAEEQGAMFDYFRRNARQTLQDHYSWWHFPKQDRRAG